MAAVAAGRPAADPGTLAMTWCSWCDHAAHPDAPCSDQVEIADGPPPKPRAAVPLRVIDCPCVRHQFARWYR